MTRLAFAGKWGALGVSGLGDRMRRDAGEQLFIQQRGQRHGPNPPEHLPKKWRRVIAWRC